MRKKAQVGMSFSMLFSIILIVIFVGLAIYIIMHFLNLQKCTQIGMFADDLQGSVDEVWKTSSKTTEFSQPLPTSINYICFADFSKPANNKEDIYDYIKRYEDVGTLFFYPGKKACKFPYYDLKNINIDEITSEQNPYCIKNNGKPVLKLSKDFYEALVKIE